MRLRWNLITHNHAYYKVPCAKKLPTSHTVTTDTHDTHALKANRATCDNARCLVPQLVLMFRFPSVPVSSVLQFGKTVMLFAAVVCACVCTRVILFVFVCACMCVRHNVRHKMIRGGKNMEMYLN